MVDSRTPSPNAARSSGMAIRSLSKFYEGGPMRIDTLKDCSFKLDPGRLTVLIGPSGSGKSTLINILAGYEKPSSGEILLDGVPVSGPSRDRLVVFQEAALFPWMTTFANVAYGPRVQRQRSSDDIRTETIRILEKVGLQDFMGKYPTQLSGGMQRRAELARAMINDPKVMFLDEPFRGLDAMTRELMQEYFLKIYEDRRQTALFVTSEIDEAIFLADTLLIMSNAPGHVIKEIAIGLPRPREPHVLTSVEYLRYKEEALDILHVEALKAFTEGSKAATDFLEGYSSWKDQKD